MDPAKNPQAGMFSQQMDSIFSQVGSDFSIAGNIEYIKEFAFQTRNYRHVSSPGIHRDLVLWGIAGQLGSMIAGNRAGHGITGLWSALPYLFLLTILNTWLSMLDLYGVGWARFVYYNSGSYSTCSSSW